MRSRSSLRPHPNSDGGEGGGMTDVQVINEASVRTITGGFISVRSKCVPQSAKCAHRNTTTPPGHTRIHTRMVMAAGWRANQHYMEGTVQSTVCLWS